MSCEKMSQPFFCPRSHVLSVLCADVSNFEADPADSTCCWDSFPPGGNVNSFMKPGNLSTQRTQIHTFWVNSQRVCDIFIMWSWLEYIKLKAQAKNTLHSCVTTFIFLAKKRDHASFKKRRKEFMPRNKPSSNTYLMIRLINKNTFCLNKKKTLKITP